MVVQLLRAQCRRREVPHGGQADNYPRARTEEETDSVIDQGQWDN